MKLCAFQHLSRNHGFKCLPVLEKRNATHYPSVTQTVEPGGFVQEPVALIQHQYGQSFEKGLKASAFSGMLKDKQCHAFSRTLMFSMLMECAGIGTLKELGSTSLSLVFQSLVQHRPFSNQHILSHDCAASAPKTDTQIRNAVSLWATSSVHPGNVRWPRNALRASPDTALTQRNSTCQRWPTAR